MRLVTELWYFLHKYIINYFKTDVVLKKLKNIFNCENYKDLAGILNINVRTLYVWKEKNKIPSNIEGLLKLVKSQQEEIQRLKDKNGTKISG